MNKLLFTLKRGFGIDITLVCSNHLDLKDYLIKKYDWIKVDVKDECVVLTDNLGNIESADLEWIKQV